jgi:hypothetical protein
VLDANVMSGNALGFVTLSSIWVTVRKRIKGKLRSVVAQGYIGTYNLPPET